MLQQQYEKESQHRHKLRQRRAVLRRQPSHNKRLDEHRLNVGHQLNEARRQKHAPRETIRQVDEALGAPRGGLGGRTGGDVRREETNGEQDEDESEDEEGKYEDDLEDLYEFHDCGIMLRVVTLPNLMQYWVRV